MFQQLDKHCDTPILKSIALRSDAILTRIHHATLSFNPLWVWVTSPSCFWMVAGPGDAVWCEGHQGPGKRTWRLQWPWLLQRIFLRRTGCGTWQRLEDGTVVTRRSISGFFTGSDRFGKSVLYHYRCINSSQTIVLCNKKCSKEA